MHEKRNASQHPIPSNPIGSHDYDRVNFTFVCSLRKDIFSALPVLRLGDML
jgi:hypothetical protein